MLIADASYKGRDVLLRIKNRWDSGAILNRALHDLKWRLACIVSPRRYDIERKCVLDPAESFSAFCLYHIIKAIRYRRERLSRNLCKEGADKNKTKANQDTDQIDLWLLRFQYMGKELQKNDIKDHTACQADKGADQSLCHKGAEEVHQKTANQGGDSYQSQDESLFPPVLSVSYHGGVDHHAHGNIVETDAESEKNALVQRGKGQAVNSHAFYDIVEDDRKGRNDTDMGGMFMFMRFFLILMIRDKEIQEFEQKKAKGKIEKETWESQTFLGFKNIRQQVEEHQREHGS